MLNNHCFLNKSTRRHCRLEGSHISGSDTNRTGAESLYFYLLPQTAVLPGSDAGSDGIKPASGFVIQTSDLALHLVPNVWGTLLGRGL